MKLGMDYITPKATQLLQFFIYYYK